MIKARLKVFSFLFLLLPVQQSFSQVVPAPGTNRGAGASTSPVGNKPSGNNPPATNRPGINTQGNNTQGNNTQGNNTQGNNTPGNNTQGNNRSRNNILGNTSDSKEGGSNDEGNNTEGGGSGTQSLPGINSQANAAPIDPRIFGAELFNNPSLSFQPDLRIATPVNYVLGPDDALAISVYGLQEASFNLTISPEGTIYIPNIGVVSVSGLTVEAATARIRSKMSSIYGSLRSGASKLSITLSKIRSIRITILGAAKSGTYTVSSLSTLFNALFLAGGPAQNRSFRKIELIRNNKVQRVVDLYQFLLTADQSDNVRLQDNDVIRLPVYDTRVEITGEVKRPGIYEMLKTENASDLIRFASGFTDLAYKASIKVYQLTETDRRLQDLKYADFVKYVPQSGDLFEVSQILDVFQNRVSVNGAVLRGGNFELTPGLTAGDLIKKAILRDDAYTDRGQIVRTKEDLSQEIISFDVRAAVNGLESVPLQREDNIRIYSLTELRDVTNVRIQGEVRKPGIYTYVANLTLKDVILLAGGFSDAAYPQKIEVARVIRRDTLTAQDERLSQIIEVRNLDDLSVKTKNLFLQPNDVVTVRRLPGYLPLESVFVTGQVQFPGPYALANREEKISDLIKRAGGFTPEAFTEGAFLKRVNERDIASEKAAETAEKIQEALKDSSGQLSATIRRPFDQIPLNLKKIMSQPGIDEDLVLKQNDELYIPKNDEEIRINGEVLYPTLALYSKTKSLKDYVNDAGGFTDNAHKKKAYVLYPNGKAASTTHFLFFRHFPEIRPGSEIVIPKYIVKVKQRRSVPETVALASALSSLAYIVLIIARL